MKTAILTLALSIVVAGSAFAQEHPEHPKPKSDAKQEHPSHSYTMDELEKAITSEIETAQASNGGSYKMEDKEAQKTWTMKLDHVHRERLAKLDATTATVVIHGSADPLITPSGGEATAKAIPGAELIIIEGMGHELPPGAWPTVVEAIVANANRAARR